MGERQKTQIKRINVFIFNPNSWLFVEEELVDLYYFFLLFYSAVFGST